MERTMQKCTRVSRAYGTEHRAQGTGLMAVNADLPSVNFASPRIGFLNLTRREGEMETRENSLIQGSSLSPVKHNRVEVLYLYLGFGLRDMTRREAETETRENSRVSVSSLNAVTMNDSEGYQNEVCYSEVKGSVNDPASAGQIAEKGRKANHFQVSGSDRRSISTMNFELFFLQDAWETEAVKNAN